MEINLENPKSSSKLELVKLLESKECQLLKTGYKNQMMVYYFCSCDPDQKQPMCLDCYNVCHKDHIKKELISYHTSAICYCGSQSHLLDQIEIKNDNFDNECLFMEWSYISQSKVYFQNINNKNFCLFCANFCENISNLNKKNSNQNLPACDCKNEVHQDVKSIYKKLITLRNLEDFNFENLTNIHMINLIITSENSFKYYFDNFINYLKKLKTNLNDVTYVLDHNIAYSASMKAIETFSILSDGCHNLFYFTENLDLILDKKFVFSLIEKKFDYKVSKTIWNLKYHILNIFNKFVIKRDFECVTILTLKDIENMNPLQRILYIKSVMSQGDLYQNYFGNLNLNILEMTINSIEKLNSIKEKNEIFYEILAKLYEICLIYASLNQFTQDQLIRFSRLNDEVISSTEADKKILSQILIKSQMKMLVQMVKSISYFVYFTNDEILLNYIISEKDIQNLNFFHSTSEIGKMINRNCINILSYIRHTKKSIENFGNAEIKISSNFLIKSSYTLNMKESQNNLNNLYDNNLIEKMTKKILVYATNITSITINYPDSYLIGLRRLIEKNKNNYLNLILNNDDKKFVDDINLIREEMENIFIDYFNFESNENEIVQNVLLSIKKFYKISDINYKDFITPHEVDNITENLDKIDNELNSEENKFKILINKTFFINSIIKSLKILISAKNNDKNNIDENFLDEILKFLYFYIKENPDNCILLLTTEIIETFFQLNPIQLDKIFDLILFNLFTLIKFNINMNNMNTLIKEINKLLSKISNETQWINLIEKIIKIIKLMTEVSFLNQDYVFNKLRQVVMNLYEKNPILKEYKNYLIDSKENENELHNEYNLKNLLKVYTKFLQLINLLFDGNATLNEIPFLNKIIEESEIPQILRKKNLDLSLRIEILIFFRMSNIDVIIDNEKMEEYLSLFINPIKLPEQGSLYESGYDYKFFNDLLFVNETSISLQLELNILKFELRFFNSIIEESNCKNSQIILEYLQQGIILPLFVFITKFMAIIFNLNGYEYLKLYEIVVYFLNLKKFIINQKYQEDLTNFEIKSIFKSYLQQIKRKKYSLLEKGFTKSDLIEVTDDIEQMNKPNFELLNYRKVYFFFEKHIEGFIKKIKNKSLVKLFEKRENFYSDIKLKKMDSVLKLKGIIKSPQDKKILDAIVKYENDKNKFHQSGFVQNLTEQNLQFDSNYRNIILKTVFFLVNDEKLSDKYKKQNFWNLFKLLQFDTIATQNEIYALYKENKSFINLGNIMNIFLQNFLSLIFSSCNPSSTIMNEDYYLSINIVKILKYLCEEHNLNFQTIFFQELKFNCQFVKTKGQVSLFDLMLGVISKIIVLSKWERVRFETEENSITYFYDIYFVIIELLIEMVQGTSKENLEIILLNYEEENMFNKFLNRVKYILLKDQNDSAILYKVRKDIIEFIVAFLEEKSTPIKLINLISSIFNPYSIFETILNNLKKLYLKKTQQNVKNYQNHIFDHKMCQFFIDTYFSDLDFCKTPEFELSNRLYQYVKLLATQFNHEDANNIINSIKLLNEENLIDSYNKKIDHHTGIILDENYLQNYFTVKFFEKITRSVTVQMENEIVTVLFTINPLIPILSLDTKLDFIENVNRESRYTKLLSLMENCDYFFDEINYNATKLSNSFILRKLNLINYHFMEFILFLLVIAKNIIMFFKIDTTEKLADFPTVYPATKSIAIIELIFNSIFVISWFISKFPLFHNIEKKKYMIKLKINEGNLSIIDKFKIVLFYTIFDKNKINGFLWNIIFAGIGISAPINTFIYSTQLLIMINLSEVLKNLIKSVPLRYRQLLAASTFLLIFLYIFSNIAFFFLNDDFMITLGGGGHRMLSGGDTSTSHGSADEIGSLVTGGQVENQCGSLLYCFLLHFDYGLRTDGGMGEHLKKLKLYDNPGYYMGRFFYEVLYFFIIDIILLAIVAGIIIDTFADLAEEMMKIEEDKLNKCYICGAFKEDLEKKCINFKSHVANDHLIWTYVEYIIGLKFVDPQETNAVNSHVIDMIENKSISWFPAFKSQNDEIKKE